MSLTKRQHYVPQFYLKYFTDNEDERLFVHDKESDKIFSKNIQEMLSLAVDIMAGFISARIKASKTVSVFKTGFS